jgi:hypothetical protein
MDIEFLNTDIKDYPVFKDNRLREIRGEYKYTTTELKVINHLIANIKPNEEDFEWKSFKIRDIIGEDSKNHKHIQDMCVGLLSKPFIVPGTKNYVNWFADINIISHSGEIEYRFSSVLKDYLIGLLHRDEYYHFQLSDILKLNSSYEIQIFEIISSIKNMAAYTFDFNYFKQILGFSEGYRNNDVKRKLKEVQKNLAIKTDLTFNFKLHRVKSRSYNKIVLVAISSDKYFRGSDKKPEIKNNIESYESIEEYWENYELPY